MASISWLGVVYALLFLATRRDEVGRVLEFLSVASPPCVVGILAIVVYDIDSCATEFENSTLEWLRAFPIPIIFAVCSAVNCQLAIVVVIVHKQFPLPELVKLILNICCSKCRRCKKVIAVDW